MSCAHCHRDLRLSRIVGYVHSDDRSYWCDSSHLWHANPDITANVLCCESMRQRFGFLDSR